MQNQTLSQSPVLLLEIYLHSTFVNSPSNFSTGRWRKKDAKFKVSLGYLGKTLCPKAIHPSNQPTAQSIKQPVSQPDTYIINIKITGKRKKTNLTDNWFINVYYLFVGLFDSELYVWEKALVILSLIETYSWSFSGMESTQSCNNRVRRPDIRETVTPCMPATLPERLWSFTNVICVASKPPLVLRVKKTKCPRKCI